VTAAEASKTDSKYEADQQKLRALNRYYRKFGKVCYMPHISGSMKIVFHEKKSVVMIYD